MLRLLLYFTSGWVLGIFLFFSVKAKIEPLYLDQKITAVASDAQNSQPTTETPVATTATSTPSPTPTPKPSIKPTPSPSATPKPIPQPLFSSEQIYGFTDRFASQYSVDANILRHIALCESGFNQSATNGPYLGLYQFGAITWSNFRKALGEDPDTALRLNAEEAVQTAAYALSLGKLHIWPNCQP